MIRAWLTSLNTHKIGGIGIGTAILSIAAMSLRAPIDAALIAHPGVASSVSRSLIDDYILTFAAPVVATVGASMAYVGRPTTISPPTTDTTK